MKKAFYIAAALLLNLTNSQAQTAGPKVSEIENEDDLPSIGVRYYYYPNLDAYFDTQTNLYIYEYQGEWIKNKELMSGLRGYSLLNSVRVPIENYNGDKPYTKLAEHRKLYPKKYSSKRVAPKVVKEVGLSTK